MSKCSQAKCRGKGKVRLYHPGFIFISQDLLMGFAGDTDVLEGGICCVLLDIQLTSAVIKNHYKYTRNIKMSQAQTIKMDACSN